MKLGLGISANPEDPVAVVNEINANCNVLNGALDSAMSWAPISGAASGAGLVVINHALGVVPDIYIIAVSATGITHFVTNAVKASWTKTTISVNFSGACTFFGFVGKLE